MKKIFLFLLSAAALVGFFWGTWSLKPKNSENFQMGEVSSAIYPIIAPHFDAFASERRSFLKKLSSNISPKKIILLSVDHYDSGKKNISATNKKWQTIDGEFSLEQDIFASLVAEGIVNEDEGAFVNEHGIKNVIPDLLEYLPSSKILPIMIKDKTTEEEIDNLYEGISQNCGNDCLVVGSVDFSHYNQNSLAQIHDDYSIDALNNLDEDKVKKAETDSPNILSILVRLAKSKDAKGFKVSFNGNSGEKIGDDSIESTSVVIGQFQGEKISNKVTTLMFSGDMMTDRFVYHSFKDDLSEAFSQLGNRVFWGTNASILNNEGPISDEPISDDISSDNLVFNFPTQTIDALKYLHIDAVSLANNHSLNAGNDGFSKTKQLLSKNNIDYFGSQNNFDDSSALAVDGDIPVSVVGVNLLSNPDLSAVKSKIKALKSSGGFVIVFPHWGNEYQNDHSSNQEAIARDLISSGADAIIGTHPHVVQDFQIIDGRPVIYSLGNFIFDQSFSKETMEGLTVGLVIRDSSIDISFFPTKQVNLKPSLMTGAEKAAKIKNILDIDTENGFKKLRSDTIRVDRIN